jgi:hypothetical protein
VLRASYLGIVAVALGMACGGPARRQPSAPTTAVQGGGGKPVAPATSVPEGDLATLRRALAGASLSDAEVRWLDAALRRSKSPYTDRGLETFVEWGLVAEVTRKGDVLALFVSGPRVNAEWKLEVLADGTVKEGTVYTLD